MQRYCSIGPLECIFMALFEIAHFSILWSNLIAWGTRTFLLMSLPLYHAFIIDMVIAMEHGIPALNESRCLL